MGAADAVTTEATGVLRQSGKRMFKPGLTDLFESLVIIRATAHSIEILWNHWVIGLWQCEPIQVFGSRVAGSSGDRETHLRSSAAQLLHLSDSLGTLEEGKLADVIVVDGDVLDDINRIANPENVRVVLKGGGIAKQI